MRLATIKTWAGPRAALYLPETDSYLDIHATEANLPGNVRQLLEGGPDVLRAVAALAQRPTAVKQPAVQATLYAPIVDPQKIICVGLNYKDHAAETNAPLPREPILFSKYATALCGQGEPIVLPKVSAKVDYEAELVIVIGKKGRHVTLDGAMDHVAGYTVGHDVSARDWQLEKDGKQWMVGKTFDTFAPAGPVLVSKDEIADPQNLAIQLRLNGTVMQSSNTNQMIFGVVDLLVYITQVFTLEPGDLIFTGTPPGVGFARKPPVFLKGGDVVEIEIEKLGVLRNPVIQA
jgi:2-keto-4-pentenoate hydratase/2-oxohepta-3-ene-1,7-dioic acid hydratase in catechol pathway